MLDTNVIVAAFRSRNGASNLLLHFLDPALFHGAVSGVMRAVLRTRKATGHSLENVAAVMSALAAVSEGIDIPFRTRPMPAMSPMRWCLKPP